MTATGDLLGRGVRLSSAAGVRVLSGMGAVGLVTAAALDGLGDSKRAARLRAEWLERHGAEYYEQALRRLP